MDVVELADVEFEVESLTTGHGIVEVGASCSCSCCCICSSST
jgi:hypothetical protein